MYVLLLFMLKFLNITILQLLKKQLQRHILSFAPTAKIESIRFRSIPFQVPTTKLPDSDDEGIRKRKRGSQDPREATLLYWRANQGDKEKKA
jgi:nucleolar protein 12